MRRLTSEELRQEYIKFFQDKGHVRIPSHSLIPENDPTVLFTTAGMHPLVPYLMGEKHPQGKRLVNVQKCVRTGDIDVVGDSSHCTFFEMLGNWSLGDYFKEESIKLSYEFLTKVLEINPKSLAVTVFQGDENAPKDTESAKVWKDLGVDENRIFYLPKADNWWGPAGLTGPCGPDTEIFYDTGKPSCSKNCNPACNCGKYLEIWNNVFMQYNKTKNGEYEPLVQKNVDTGMGLERTVCVLNSLSSVYESDLFHNIIELIEQSSGKSYGESDEITKAIRIIADHLRTSLFILADGIVPSNVDQGYVLRRLIRRAVRFSRSIDLSPKTFCDIIKAFISNYRTSYPELLDHQDKIIQEVEQEQERFTKTIEQGMKEFEKVVRYMKTDILNGKTAFRLYDTFGFPIEITQELAQEKGLKVDIEGYHRAYEEHQRKSKAGAEQKFKGGLQDDSNATTNLHTATHIMHTALMKVLGAEVRQRGSNITAERLRFDFEFSRPMTKEEITAVEDLVNKVINERLDISCQEMSVDDAIAQGAIGVFSDRYSDRVKVYSVGDFSKEICGGPHAVNTSDLGEFKIIKEQSSSAGVRRIRAILNK